MKRKVLEKEKMWKKIKKRKGIKKKKVKECVSVRIKVKKSQLMTVALGMKYVVHKVGTANWCPS